MLQDFACPPTLAHIRGVYSNKIGTLHNYSRRCERSEKKPVLDPGLSLTSVYAPLTPDDSTIETIKYSLPRFTLSLSHDILWLFFSMLAKMG